MEGSLVDGSVTEVAEAAAFESFVFYSVCEAEGEGSLSAYDSVTAPEVFLRVEEVHGSTFAFRATGVFTVELGHEFIHVHATC